MTVAELPQVTERESVTSTVAPLPPPKERLVALDVFRGMTIAGMLLTVKTPALAFRWLAWLTWSSGIALTVMTILDIRVGVVISSAALMIFFIPFVVLMARR